MTDSATTASAPLGSSRLRNYVSSTSFLSGAFFGSLGLAFVIFGRDYRVGDLRSMGPGMFPVADGWLLLLLGGVVTLSHREGGERAETVVWRPLVAILASVVAFALLVDGTGLLIAGSVLIGGALIATGQGTLRNGIVLSIVLTTTSSVIFPTLLGVPLKVFP